MSHNRTVCSVGVSPAIPMYYQAAVAMKNSKVRTYAPFFLLCFSLLSSLNMILSSVHLWHFHSGRDEVTLSEEKFSRLKLVLPQVGPVGYVTENPEFRVNVLTDPQATKEYFLAQYTLCPRILVNSSRPKFVVSNFGRNRRSASATVISRYHPSTFKDFGSGIIVFQNK